MYEDPVTAEDIAEALHQSKGFLFNALDIIKKNTGHQMTVNTLKNRIRDWGLEEYLYDIRTHLVESCKKTLIYKAIKEKDNMCLFWILKRYGHHVDFINSVDSETESKRGWKALLEHVKTAPES